MSVRNLEYLFRPRSLAVIGASMRPQRVGTVVMRNLLAGGFAGPIMPVNPKYPAIGGVLAYADIPSLPVAPDLGVICTPARTVPELVRQLGERGARAAVVLSAGLNHERDDSGRTYAELMREAARPFNLRVLGPNCLGLMVPGNGLNASFAHMNPLPGKIAFVSQSGALCTAVLDWAKDRDIGFSHFISLGEAADVDFDDVLDYLASEPTVRAILLYIESIHQRRHFMSAARAAARTKMVLTIKSGRVAEGASAAASHTGALAGSDDVYDAAFRRAGMLRVREVAELFGAVETLARSGPLKGERLVIMTNGGGPGVMAVDTLIQGGGKLATLSPETIAALDAVLPKTWSRANPVDIIGDAPGKRYAEALSILMNAPETDAVLVMHAPTAIASSEEAARAVVEVVRGDARQNRPNILTNWIGEESVRRSREIFRDAGLPTYRTPESSVRAFLQLAEYRRNQEMLMETPPSAPSEFTPAAETARLIVENALSRGETMLNEAEAKAILAAYGIPTVETHVVSSEEAAVRVAREMGFPVALKILSPDVTHKSDVGGVVLDLDKPEAVDTAARAMRARVLKAFPEARITGFTVQRMARRPRAHELIVGAATDPIFGPVLLFGQGGTAVEVIADRAVALPPLNMNLARELMARTRVYRLLRGYRDRPAANLDAISLTLLQISQMVIDIPEILELDINPLFADEQGVLALDARIRVAPAESIGAARLAIRPYPKDLEEPHVLPNGRKVLLRPIRPEDEPAHRVFISKLTREDIYYRFFGVLNELPHSTLARFTQIDYDREMAFIASARDEHGEPETLGVVRTLTDPDNQQAEFAIVVRSDTKGQKLGRKLMDKMIAYCRARGTVEIVGRILAENRAMIRLAESLGFSSKAIPGESAVEVRVRL